MDYIKNFVVMRAPMEGGEPQVVTETYAPGEMLGDVGFGISTDGKQLVFLIVRSGGGGQVPGIFVMDLDGGEERHKRVECDARISGVPRFTPDGSAVAYPIRSNQVDNLWLQPLDGRGGRQITNFKSDTIKNFEYSPDGKQLGVLRSHMESDVVILRDAGQ